MRLSEWSDSMVSEHYQAWSSCEMVAAPPTLDASYADHGEPV